MSGGRVESLRIVDLVGPPHERGRAHGEELREVIGAAMGRWHEMLARSVDDVRNYLDRFLAETAFDVAIERHVPGMLDEVRGLAEGADLEFDECFAYQLMDEEWWYRCRHLEREGAQSRCSSVAITDSVATSTILAQNMDLPAHFDGSQVVLRVREPAGDALVFTAAGLVALDGCNDRGVGVCVNTLMQLAKSPRGLPVAFAIHAVLGRDTLTQAVAVLGAAMHASGQNFLVASPEGLVDLECSAGQVRRYQPSSGWVAHTNHPLVNDDLEPAGAEARGGQAAFANSEARFELLCERVLAGDAAGVAGLQALLADRTVPISVTPRPEKPSITFGSLVMELRADPVLHIAPGPPSETPWVSLRFH